MIEQELQNQENVAPPSAPPPPPNPTPVFRHSEEPDLFNHYEIKPWNYSSTLYKILAGSAVLNIVALLLVGQSHLLTQKGCDSPFVSSICQVLDTVYVGARLMDGNNEFSVRDYNKTKIDDAGDIDYIEVSPVTEPLDYPDGYFALANPDEITPIGSVYPGMPGIPGEMSTIFEPPPTGSISTFPSNNSGGLPPQILPPFKPNAVTGDIPDSPLGGTKAPRPYPAPRIGTVRPRRGNQGFGGGSKMIERSPTKLPDLEEEAKVASINNPINKPTPTPTPTPVTPAATTAELIPDESINKKPLLELSDTVLSKVDKKEVDLSKPFLLSMFATINKDGRFDAKNSRYIKQTGDKQISDLAKDAVEAIGDSGILQYLARLDVEKINFTIVQDDKQLSVILTSDQPSESTARTISSGLTAAMYAGKVQLNKKISDNPSSPSSNDVDTLALLNAAKVEAQGKSFVLKFNLNKPDAQNMIDRQLKKSQAKRQQLQQPNGTIDSKPVQNAGR